MMFDYKMLEPHEAEIAKECAEHVYQVVSGKSKFSSYTEALLGVVRRIFRKRGLKTHDFIHWLRMANLVSEKAMKKLEKGIVNERMDVYHE